MWDGSARSDAPFPQDQPQDDDARDDEDGVTPSASPGLVGDEIGHEPEPGAKDSERDHRPLLHHRIVTAPSSLRAQFGTNWEDTGASPRQLPAARRIMGSCA